MSHRLTLSRCVLIVLYQPGQTKVCNLAHEVISHQDVRSSQVPVDVVHPLDERHAVSDLQAKEKHPTASPDVCFEIQNIFSFKSVPNLGEEDIWGCGSFLKIRGLK